MLSQSTHTCMSYVTMLTALVKLDMIRVPRIILLASNLTRRTAPHYIIHKKIVVYTNRPPSAARAPAANTGPVLSAPPRAEEEPDETVEPEEAPDELASDPAAEKPVSEAESRPEAEPVTEDPPDDIRARRESSCADCDSSKVGIAYRPEVSAALATEPD